MDDADDDEEVDSDDELGVEPAILSKGIQGAKREPSQARRFTQLGVDFPKILSLRSFVNVLQFLVTILYVSPRYSVDIRSIMDWISFEERVV